MSGARRPKLDPLGLTLPEFAGLIADLEDPNQRQSLRLRFREDELECRRRAKSLRVAERVASEFAKVGGGSLLAATVALAVARQQGWSVYAVAALALLFFLVGTIFSAAFEYRAVAWDIKADRLAAALAEASG